MRGFRIGQRVRVIDAGSEATHLIGHVGSVVSELHPFGGRLVHIIELDGVPRPKCPCGCAMPCAWCFAPRELVPIDDGDDRFAPGSMDRIERTTGWSPRVRA